MAEEFTIRLATIDDIRNIFELSNDDTVRQNSIHAEKIEWEDHVRWYKHKLSDKDSIFYVAYSKEYFVGYCRLDKNEYQKWVVTIHINPKMRSKGYGKLLLNYVCKENNSKNIIAYIKPENKNSYNLFIGNNFNNLGYENVENIKCYKFEYHIPKYVIAVSNNLYNKTKIFDKKNIITIREKNDLTYDKLKQIDPKFVFFPHWSYIIPAQIYEKFNCIIFHMTDLPYGRGGSPLQNLIERGIKQTKISAIKCVKELDAGDIYLKKDFDISYGSAQEIYARAGEIISQMIDEIILNNPAPVPQKGEIVEFKRRKPEQSDIKDLNDLEKLYDYIRMLDADGYPKAFLKINDIKYSFNNVKFNNDKLIANVEIEVEKNE